MIIGTINARHEIVIPFEIRDSAGREHPVEAILDTGFTAASALPPLVIAALGLLWESETITILANGSIVKTDNYNVTIIWDGKPRPILVQAMNNVPMLGLTLMIGCDLRARFTANGRVEIETVP